MNFVQVNHRTPRRPSACATCSRPLQRGYVHDLATHNRYCGGACYHRRTSRSCNRSPMKADPLDLVILLIVLPKFTINVVRTAFDFAWGD